MIEEVVNNLKGSCPFPPGYAQVTRWLELQEYVRDTLGLPKDTCLEFAGERHQYALLAWKTGDSWEWCVVDREQMDDALYFDTSSDYKPARYEGKNFSGNVKFGWEIEWD